MRLLAFCEAPADFRTVSQLVERVLIEHGPDWVRANAEARDAFRTWHPAAEDEPFFDLHRLDDYATRHRAPRVHGHFAGQPGAAGAAMARKAFLLVRKLNDGAAEPIEGVVLVWDADEAPGERARGLEQARDDAASWAGFAIAHGLADLTREAWVLAGFEPLDDEERARLAALERELSLSPVTAAARLRARNEGDPRSPKRVLRALTGDDPEREARCWTHTALDVLRARGGDTGLTAFLDRVRDRLVPLLGPR